MAYRRRGDSIELQNLNYLTASNPHGGIAQAPETARTGGNVDIQDFEAVEQQLERADGGTTAWGVLAAAFVFEGLLFGKYCSSLSLAGNLNNG